MTHTAEPSPPPKRLSPPWSILLAVAIFLAGSLASALVGYGRDQKALAEHDARSATTSDVQRLDAQDARMSERIAALEALRQEDSERLKNIERMLVEMYRARRGAEKP